MYKIIIYLMFFTKASFFMGTGLCDSNTDYCPDPVGVIGFDLTIAEHNKHSVTVEAVHYSEIEMENADRGTEFYLIKYNFEIFNRLN